MKLLNKSLGAYMRDVRAGVWLLAAFFVLRFLMQPVFGVPYASGTMFTSMTIVLLIAALVYAFRYARQGGSSYRDILGMTFVLVLASETLISLGIAIDDYGGIQTYFTDPAHSLANPVAHLFGHLIPGTLLSTLVLWGVGALILLAAGKKARPLRRADPAPRSSDHTRLGAEFRACRTRAASRHSL